MNAAQIRLITFAAVLRVAAARIALPDFDDGVTNRLAVRVEDPPRQVRDLADGLGDAVVDDQQVVVRVERQPVGVERPLRLPRGERELLGVGELAEHCGAPLFALQTALGPPKEL